MREVIRAVVETDVFEKYSIFNPDVEGMSWDDDVLVIIFKSGESRHFPRRRVVYWDTGPEELRCSVCNDPSGENLTYCVVCGAPACRACVDETGTCQSCGEGAAERKRDGVV